MASIRDALMLVFLPTFFSQSTAGLERYKCKCEEAFLLFFFLKRQLAYFLSHLHLYVALNAGK